jgi:hypothetical protein
LASLLNSAKYVEDKQITDYPKYTDFLIFLVSLLKNNSVRVHTLNHDLFFDFLAKNHQKLSKMFSDGFSLTVSNVFLEVDKTDKNVENIKLEQFSDKYNKPLSLYKLHGSISYKTLLGINRITKVPNIHAVSRFYKIENERRTELLDKIPSEFLSGTTNKILHYKDPFFDNLFNHFKHNLLNSKLLIVIGYGFQDSGINEYLKKYYLSKAGKMIVIDPNPNLLRVKMAKYEVLHIEKCIANLTAENYQIIENLLYKN